MRWPAAAVLAGLAAGTGVIAGLPAISAPVQVAALVATSMAIGGWVAGAEYSQGIYIKDLICFYHQDLD